MTGLVDIGRSPLQDVRAFRGAFDSVCAEAASAAHGPIQAHFSPYSFEGGSVGAIAGEDFVVVAGDTRMSLNSMSVVNRHYKKIHKLNDGVYMGSAGFAGDINEVVKILRTRMKVYKFNFHEEMDVNAASELLSRTLYYKRFFPFYAANVLVGLDDKGVGAVYTYDPVGTIERVPYSIQGAGTSLIEPFFDSHVGFKTQPAECRIPLTMDRAMAIMKDAFRGAAERETSIGDSLYYVVITKDGVKEDYIGLRSD